MDYNRFTYELQARNFPVSKSRIGSAPHQSPATHQPPPQFGRGTYSLPTGSAHANGGAAGVKKRFSLAARHRFFGQAPKKWGRKAAGGSDHRPAYRRTRTNPRINKRGNPRRGFPLRPPPALMRAKESSARCGGRPEALPLDSTAFEKAGETFIRASRREGRQNSLWR